MPSSSSALYLIPTPQGERAGVAVFRVEKGGSNATFSNFVPVRNVINGTDVADTHGLCIRPTNNQCKLYFYSMG